MFWRRETKNFFICFQNFFLFQNFFFQNFFFQNFFFSKLLFFFFSLRDKRSATLKSCFGQEKQRIFSFVSKTFFCSKTFFSKTFFSKTFFFPNFFFFSSVLEIKDQQH